MAPLDLKLAKLVLKAAQDVQQSAAKGKANKNKQSFDFMSVLPQINTTLLRKFSEASPDFAKKLQTKIGGQAVPVTKISGAPSGIIKANSGTTNMVVVKTEPFYNVAGSTGFSVTGLDFFPQNAALPWLASISSSFVEYQILDLEFTYVPYVPTTTTGAVSLAWTGDYADTDPTDMTGMLSTEQSLIAPCYAGSEGGAALQYFGIPEGNVVGFKVPRYTYTQGGSPKTYRNLGATKFAAATVEMRNMYSPGRLLVGTEGEPNTNSVGRVFVRYKIKLMGSVKASLNA